MKIKPLIIACLAGLLLNTAISQNTVAQTASQIKKMRAVGIPVILPSYIPPGYKLTSFKIDFSDGHSYEAMYEGPNNCGFGINGSDSSIGGDDPIRLWTVNTELFGKLSLQELSNSNGKRPNFFQAMASPEFPKYPKAGYTFAFGCEYSVFSRQQAEQILKSAHIVK
jgi:hypothetical protein